MIEIKHPLHVAVLVTDLAKADHFYGAVLGLPKVERSLRFPGSWYQIGLFQIHLIVAEGLNQALQNPEKLGRNPHMAFAVADLEATKQQLIGQGFPVQLSQSGRLALFTQDPDGNVVELSQIS
ncbi:MAG: VOC family protein [Leptolyngbyaceae cyanobacterium MO_188.B28]|nr:VOC family protein [Leptolyngbyaceae cyanobacterium MO_188.B28]